LFSRPGTSVVTPGIAPRPLFATDTFEWAFFLPPFARHVVKNSTQFLSENYQTMKKSKSARQRRPSRSFTHPSLSPLYHRGTTPVNGKKPPKQYQDFFAKIPLKQNFPFCILNPLQSKFSSFPFERKDGFEDGS
jgi:hypothetical protein